MNGRMTAQPDHLTARPDFWGMMDRLSQVLGRFACQQASSPMLTSRRRNSGLHRFRSEDTKDQIHARFEVSYRCGVNLLTADLSTVQVAIRIPA